MTLQQAAEKYAAEVAVRLPAGIDGFTVEDIKAAFGAAFRIGAVWSHYRQSHSPGCDDAKDFCAECHAHADELKILEQQGGMVQ